MSWSKSNSHLLPCMTAENKLRTVRLSPYRKGCGPTFTLTTWDAGQTQTAVGTRPTHNTVAYELRMHDAGVTWPVFVGADYGCPMHCAIDSDACVRGILSFLTLRPGDTDADYFAAYTPDQLAYCAAHAEALSLAVFDRFGEQ